MNQMLKVGLLGEKLQVYTSQGSSKVQWNKYSSSKLLTWYKVRNFLFFAVRDPLNIASHQKSKYNYDFTKKSLSAVITQ